MIPIHLYISGFLSYRDPAEIDFTSFELACIAGANGAGKSSLLDAITWALFGQARRRDDAVINSKSNLAEVTLTFGYEGNAYRVQRIKPRDKTALLEFYILQEGDPGGSRADSQTWKPLTEHTLRETEARIEQTLRLNYETFVNAAFFLQGKADQFTQQRPGDRKRILGSILGLDLWEVYREKAADSRKKVEADIARVDGQLNEIQAELAEEQSRRGSLAELESNLENISKQRSNQESAVKSIREIVAALEKQGKLAEALRKQMEAAISRLEEIERRVFVRQQEWESYTQISAREKEIREAYTAWQSRKAELEQWEAVAAQFREQEKRREGPRQELNAAQARLEQEKQMLIQQQVQVEAARQEIRRLLEERDSLNLVLAELENLLERRQALDAALQEARQRQAEARAENPRLRDEMDTLKERIAQLTQVEEAACPVCGRPLDSDERLKLIDELNAEGRDLGDRYRANQTLMREGDTLVSDLEKQITESAQVENNLHRQQQRLAELNSRSELLQEQETNWTTGGEVRLREIEEILVQESYAPEARQRLAEIDVELLAIGYDAAAHEGVVRWVNEQRGVEDEVRALEVAQATQAPLEREIAGLRAEIQKQQEEVARQESQYGEAEQALTAAQAQAPDLISAERLLYQLQEQENRLRLEVGAARQKVLVLDDLKARRDALQKRREEHARLVGRYKLLERSFGKDGVPALLIEQALPEIETKANEILERLSGGNMVVRFATQSAYKDKRREDLKETLEIQISDGDGSRDYEMFSGGEAFRVNFAIRLALSEVLSQRAGARLQTLIIDEGFGSQDAQGRQRLIEAINLVRGDFAKVLVITHIDELKDAFPNRIEVEKTERGSTVRVV